MFFPDSGEPTSHLQAPAGHAQEEQLQEVHWSPILIDCLFEEKFLKRFQLIVCVG
jgi:hypothetical protein